MKYILIFLFFISCKATNSTADKVLWQKNKPLHWNDFKGNPEASGYSASIYSTIELIKLENGGYKICAVMNTKTSWHKQKPNECLPHEQYHFNITELFARKLRKQVKEKNLEINSLDFRKAFANILVALNKEQKIYDEETNHSIIKSKQIEWQKIIDEQLKELEIYEL